MANQNFSLASQTQSLIFSSDIVHSKKKSINLITSSTNFFRCSGFPTWHTTPSTLPPSPLSCSTARSTFACFRLLTITAAPSRHRRRAMLNPILHDAEGITGRGRVRDYCARDTSAPPTKFTRLLPLFTSLCITHYTQIIASCSLTPSLASQPVFLARLSDT